MINFCCEFNFILRNFFIDILRSKEIFLWKYFAKMIGWHKVLGFTIAQASSEKKGFDT